MLADCGALELLSEEGRRQHLLVLPKACRSSAMSRDVISLSSGALPKETTSAIASSPPTLCGIVVGTTSALPAVQQVTSTIPIILAYSVDPVGLHERAFRLETAIARPNFLVMTAFHLLLCFV